MSFELKAATDNDVSYLLELRKKTMTLHLENEGIFLSEEQHISRIMEQYDGSHIILKEGEPIGMIKLNEHESALEIMQIQIDPLFQRQGFGRNIMQLMIDKAMLESKHIELTVLKKNPAKELYERLGFMTYDEDEYEFYMRRECKS